jgi:Domain of unknown function (DUF4266)
MISRSFIIISAALVLCSGCSALRAPQPWVKPYERNHLADPIMSFKRDPIDAAYMGHVRDVRESARGGDGGGGGGCGCN